ncbi:MAG: histidine phosphatase family protein [Nanoarchaeota archaeon]|nr:histidine phosphatase family protein [Nanoarchaeota archaeon]
MDNVKLNIYFIRHGEKSIDGKTLTKRGIKQINLLSKRLKKLNITKIYSSDLPRCVESLNIILKKLKLNALHDSRLREVEGVVKENPSNYPKEINKIKSFWVDLIKDEGNILVVGSGNVNRIVFAIAMGINPSKIRFVMIPSGLTHLEFINSEKTRFVYVNDTSHLPDKLKVRQAY